MSIIKKVFFSFKNYKEILTLQPFDISSEEGRSKERYRRIALTSATNVLAKVASILISLLSVPLVLNYLGKDSFGLWMTISSLIVWMQFTDFGFISGITNALSEANGREDIPSASGILSSSLFATIAFSFILFWPLLFFSSYIPWDKILKLQDASLSLLATQSFFIVGLAFLLFLPFEILKRACGAYQMGFILSMVVLISSISSLIGIGAVIFLKLDVFWLIFAVAFAPLTANIYLLLVFPKVVPWYRFHFKDISLRHLRRVFKTSVPLLAYEMCGLGMYQLINLVIARISGLSVVADYNILYRIYLSLFTLGKSLTDPFCPAIREAFERKEMDWISRSIFRAIVIRVGVLLPPGLILVFFGDQLIGMWIHQVLERGFGWVGWICFSVSLIFVAINTALGEILNSLDKIHSQIKIFLVMFLTTIGGIYFTVPIMGLSGVFLSLALSAIYPSYLSLRKLQRTIIAP